MAAACRLILCLILLCVSVHAEKSYWIRIHDSNIKQAQNKLLNLFDNRIKKIRNYTRVYRDSSTGYNYIKIKDVKQGRDNRLFKVKRWKNQNYPGLRTYTAKEVFEILDLN